MTKYEQHVAGENGWSKWIYPRRSNYKLACCDCGLVHNFQFRYAKGKYIEFRVSRNNRATAAMRRGMKGK